jgi:flagellar protein FlaG
VRSGQQQLPAVINNTKELQSAELRGTEVSISEKQLIRAIERAVQAIQGPHTRLDFSIHEKTKKIMVKVLNQDSGEVIREIPQEKHLDLLAKLWEMAGILVDEKR